MNDFSQNKTDASVLEVLGTKQVFLGEANRTQGQMLIAEITVPPGAGIPPHKHAFEDEAFYVLSGKLRVQGEVTGSVVLEPGGLFFGPRGKAHAFFCEGHEPAKLLGIAVPGSGLAAMYCEIARTMESEQVDTQKLARICERFGIQFSD